MTVGGSTAPARPQDRALRWAWPPPADWAAWFGRGLFLLLVYGPLVALILHVAGTAPALWADALALALPLGRRADLFGRSFGLALGVAVAGTVLGVLIAMQLDAWRSGWRRHLRWLVLAMIPVPAYIYALAWSATLFRLNGWLRGLNTWLQGRDLSWLATNLQLDDLHLALAIPRLPATGMLVAGWVQLMALLPLAVALALVALAAVPPELVEAGRVARSDWAVFRRITLPLAGPLILTGTGLLFLLGILDYSVPSLFQVNVYALAIFADYSATGEVVRALVMALPVLAMTAAIIVLVQARWRQAAQRPPRSGEVPAAPPAWPLGLRLVQAMALIVLALQILVPVVSLCAAVGSWSHFVETIAPLRQELAFTLGVALAAAALCLPFALAVAPMLIRGGAAGRRWWALVALPLAVPAPLVGIGLILLWNRPSLGAVYGGAAMPVLAGAARFLPLAAVVVAAQLRRIDPLLIDAAQVFQVRPASGWLQVRLPMLAPGLIAAAGLVFALTLGELGATLLVAPPGHGTLTLRIYNYLHYGASDAVAGLCLLMMAATLATGGIVVAALVLGGRMVAGGRDD